MGLEMAELLRAHTTLAENLSSVPSTQVRWCTTARSNSRDLRPLFPTGVYTHKLTIEINPKSKTKWLGIQLSHKVLCI